MSFPHLVVSGGDGNFTEVPDLFAAGVNFIKPLSLKPDDLIPLPEDSKLMELPRRVAIGYDADLEKFVQLREYDSKAVFPVAVSLPPGYLPLYRSAFSMVLDSPRLASFNYTAAAMREGRYVTAAIKIEDKLFRGFDILPLQYVNVPVNDTINKAASHLQSSANPLLYLSTMEKNQIPAATEIARAIRKKTETGLFCISSEVPDPEAVKTWCNAGVDFIGLQLNSAQKVFYEAFHDSQAYRFADLEESFRVAKKSGRRTILEYAIFPGLTDFPQELNALEKLLTDAEVDMLRLYNLAADPEWYMDKLLLMTLPRKQMGMAQWWDYVRRNLPDVQIGH